MENSLLVNLIFYLRRA